MGASISGAESVFNLGRAHLRPVVIVTVVGVLALVPIMIFGLPNGADLWNHFRFALPFYESIRSGNLYPGWLAESNNGLGDPRFRFYPPGLYYLLSVARIVTGDWYVAGILALVLLSVVGALGAYFWARSFFLPQVAMWVGIVYALAPFRLNEIYQASLLTEYAAASVLPFAFAFTERLCRKNNIYDLVGLATAYALLILTHLPLTVMGSLSLMVYALLRIENKETLAALARLSLAVVLGIAASSFFWLTMVGELSWIKGSATQPNNYYDYRFNFLFSTSALSNRNTWYANLLALAVIGFLLPALVYLPRVLRKKDGAGPFALSILLLASFFMATPLSRPVWAVVPKLSEIQFPWRWLSITTLTGALLLASVLSKWREKLKQPRPWELAVALAFVLSIAFIVTQVIYDSDYLDRSRVQPMLTDIRGAVSFKDWLPVTGSELLQVERMSGKVEAGSRPVNVLSWEPLRRVFHIAQGTEPTARMRTYFYPHWTASSNGQQLPIGAASDGLILISVPPNAADVEVVFQEPARSKFAAVVSCATWITMAGLLAFSWRRRTSHSRAQPWSDRMPQ